MATEARHGAGAVCVVLVAIIVTAAWFYSQATMSNVGELSFQNPLRIPELLQPTVDQAGVKQFELNVQAGESQFRGGQ